jgi:uncharacterized protein (DUF427 family)
VPSIPEWALKARAHWRYRGTERPPFADAPAPGQESVWDYPRPPRVEPLASLVEVRSGEIEIARTTGAFRVLETASPPTIYLPPDAVAPGRLEAVRGGSRCEWKGVAAYWDVVLPDRRLPRAAWSYAVPLPGFESIRAFVSFYPALLECFIDGERVRPQPGGFYGGWVTSRIAGPCKGSPGTEGW